MIRELPTFYDNFNYQEYDAMKTITTREILGWLHIDDEGNRDVWDKARDWPGTWVPLYTNETIECDENGVPIK